jgi:two-component system sensor histidine kinase PilS (NtrC family)
VLVNLLDNALHHGTSQAGAIRVELRLALRARADDSPARVEQLARQRGGPQVATLTVGSDGAPIPAEVESLLFEPFFSTRSRGTGLGLYICRELCERHGVSIDYERGAAGTRHLNQFVLRLPMASEPAEAPGTAPDAPTIRAAGPARPTA